MQWLSRHRRIALAAICLFWTGFIFLGRVFPNVPFLFSPWSGEQNVEDMLRRQGRKTAARSDFVFVGIDQASLQLSQSSGRMLSDEEIENTRALQLMAERAYPWSRELWALLLDKMFSAGARLVMFDMIFNNPNDGDPAFRAALDKYKDRVVIGANFDFARSAGGTNAPFVLPNTMLIPEPQYQDDRVGYVNFWPDENDGKVRAARFHFTQSQWSGIQLSQDDESFTSFSARVLHKL